MTNARRLLCCSFLIAGCAHHQPVLTIHLPPSRGEFTQTFHKGDQLRLVADATGDVQTFVRWSVQNLTLRSPGTPDCLATVQQTGPVRILASYAPIVPQP